MASITLSGWPSGATVSAYVASAIPSQTPDSDALGAAVTSGVASAAGVVTLSGLAEGVRHVASDGTTRRNFLVPAVAGASSPDALTSGEEIFPRDMAVGSVAMTTQILRLRYFTARKTETITQVRVMTHSTAAGATPSLVRMGIWTVNPADDGLTTLAASTPNDTALLAGAFTVYTKALSAGFQKTANTRYAFGLLVVTAATAPSIYSSGAQANAAAYPPRIVGQPSGQTDLPASLSAATITAGGNSGAGPYALLLP